MSTNGDSLAGRLYPNSLSKFDVNLFKNPTSHYRGAPLWSWNCKLDIPQLEEQIGHLKEMGMGGGHIHSRTGLDDEYLGTDYFNAVEASIKKAKEKGMLTWLWVLCFAWVVQRALLIRAVDTMKIDGRPGVLEDLSPKTAHNMQQNSFYSLRLLMELMGRYQNI
jgi:hypothetical protein